MGFVVVSVQKLVIKHVKKLAEIIVLGLVIQLVEMVVQLVVEMVVVVAQVVKITVHY